MSDIVVEAFLRLRGHFFDPKMRPVHFPLRDKRNTQDDPFDESLATSILTGILGVTCVKAPGALITPDLALVRPELCRGVRAGNLADALDRIVAIEVKKLERGSTGTVARATGLDYNTTPPCGSVIVYDSANKPLTIRCFYLFVCLEAAGGRKRSLTALVLADGNLLNADFEFYQSIVGERKKRIDLGTYADGADRQRPMLIFSYPLGVKELDRQVSLVHPSPDLATRGSGLKLVYELVRTKAAGGVAKFYCYRLGGDVPKHWESTVLKDPFPKPERGTKTQARGRFKLPFPT